MPRSSKVITPSPTTLSLARLATWSRVSGAGTIPSVSTFSTPVTPTLDPDPRILTAAVVNCGAHAANGQTKLPVAAYASIFMARPFTSYGASLAPTIDVEIVDITGYSGNSTLDFYIRDEAILVR